MGIEVLDCDKMGQFVGADGAVMLWEVGAVLSDEEEGKKDARDPIATCLEHEGSVQVVRWSPRGGFLASGGEDGLVVLWCRSSGADGGVEGRFGSSRVAKGRESWRVCCKLASHEMEVSDLCWSPCGTMLASGSLDKRVLVWNVGRGSGIRRDGTVLIRTPISDLRGHSSMVRAVAWDPRGDLLASQDEGGRLVLWQRGSGRSPSLMLSSQDSEDGRSEVWEAVGMCVRALEGCRGTSGRRRLSWSPDGSSLAAGGGWKEPRYTAPILLRPDLAATNAAAEAAQSARARKAEPPPPPPLAPEYELIGHAGVVTAVRFAPTGTKDTVLAVAGADAAVSIWRSDRKRPPVVLQGIATQPIADIAWSPDGNILLVATVDGRITAISFVHPFLLPTSPTSTSTISSTAIDAAALRGRGWKSRALETPPIAQQVAFPPDPVQLATTRLDLLRSLATQASDPSRVLPTPRHHGAVASDVTDSVQALQKAESQAWDAPDTSISSSPRSTAAPPVRTLNVLQVKRDSKGRKRIAPMLVTSSSSSSTSFGAKPSQSNAFDPPPSPARPVTTAVVTLNTSPDKSQAGTIRPRPSSSDTLPSSKRPRTLDPTTTTTATSTASTFSPSALEARLGASNSHRLSSDPSQINTFSGFSSSSSHPPQNNNTLSGFSSSSSHPPQNNTFSGFSSSSSSSKLPPSSKPTHVLEPLPSRPAQWSVPCSTGRLEITNGPSWTHVTGPGWTVRMGGTVVAAAAAPDVEMAALVMESNRLVLLGKAGMRLCADSVLSGGPVAQIALGNEAVFVVAATGAVDVWRLTRIRDVAAELQRIETPSLYAAALDIATSAGTSTSRITAIDVSHLELTLQAREVRRAQVTLRLHPASGTWTCTHRTPEQLDPAAWRLRGRAAASTDSHAAAATAATHLLRAADAASVNPSSVSASAAAAAIHAADERAAFHAQHQQWDEWRRHILSKAMLLTRTADRTAAKHLVHFLQVAAQQTSSSSSSSSSPATKSSTLPPPDLARAILAKDLPPIWNTPRTKSSKSSKPPLHAALAAAAHILGATPQHKGTPTTITPAGPLADILLEALDSLA